MKWVLFSFSDVHCALKYPAAVGCAYNYRNQVFTAVKQKPVTPSLCLAFPFSIFFLFSLLLYPLYLRLSQWHHPRCVLLSPGAAKSICNTLSLGQCKCGIWKLLVKLFFSRFCHILLKDHNLTTRQPFHQLLQKKPSLPSAVWHRAGKYLQLKINRWARCGFLCPMAVLKVCCSFWVVTIPGWVLMQCWPSR